MRRSYPIVEVQFEDHVFSENGLGDTYPCSVFGILVSENKYQIQVAVWITKGDVEHHTNDTYSLVKSAVKRVRRVGTWRPKQ